MFNIQFLFYTYMGCQKSEVFIQCSQYIPDTSSGHLSHPQFQFLNPAILEGHEEGILPALCTISSTFFTQKLAKPSTNNITASLPITCEEFHIKLQD